MQNYKSLLLSCIDRLFAQFDTKGTGYIDFDEFICGMLAAFVLISFNVTISLINIGLAVACRGTKDEKIHFIFNMYNVSHDNKISKQELSTLLNHS